MVGEKPRKRKEARMKTIGLLGGMSWESTVSYYRIVNTVAKERLGGLHSARCLLYSVDFQEIEACQSAGDWDRSALLLGAAAQNLEKGGADFIVICTNTMHKVAPRIQAADLHSPAAHRGRHGRRNPGARPALGGPAGHALHHGRGFLLRQAASAGP